MQSAPNASPSTPAPNPDPGLTFLIEPKPWLEIFLRNFGDLFRPDPPQVWITAAPGEYWADALVNRPVAWAAFRQSVFGHVLALLSIYGLTLLWLNHPQVLPDELPRTRPVANYQLSEYLPAIAKAEKKPEPPHRRVAQKADPEYAPQEIISVHVGHNSTQQTIVNPLNPKLLNQDVPLPNIVARAPIPSAPIVASHRVNTPLPLDVPLAVPPVEPPAQRSLHALTFPVQQPVVAPAESPVNRNLASLHLPLQSQTAVPPAPTVAQRNLGDINLAVNAPAVEAPKLPVVEQQAATGQQSAQASPPAKVIPPSEPITAGTGKSQAQEVGQLLVLNVHPVAPTGPMAVPEGNRQGEFAAGPSGHVGASAQPEIAAGSNDSPGGSKEGSSSLPGNVYIAPPPNKITAAVVVSAPSLPDAPRPTLHDTPPPRDGGTPPGRIENQVFGGRKSYSMALNMPNLTSAGGSWVMRFAEMNPIPGSAGDGVSAPEPLRKVDPAYPATLMRDRIEGVVILYAVIHSDGSVGEVRVLQGVDDTLDENARDAMQKWHFRPATKNGAPVDLEAVIKIPFRAPRRVF
jgi:TonB family protein